MNHERFFDELRQEQDRAREQARYVERAQLLRVGVQRLSTASKPRAWAFVGALGLAAAGALIWQDVSKAPAFFVGEGNQTGQLGAFLAAPNERELPLRFADGTRIALAPGTSARVASLDDHGAHIVLEKGRASASVVHRPGSHWQVDVGPYQVAVVGTRFDVNWDAGGRVLTLQLQQGAVLVSGGFLRDALSVRAGQTLRAFNDGGRVELVDSAPVASTPPSGIIQETPSGVIQREPAPAPSAAAPGEPVALEGVTSQGEVTARPALAAPPSWLGLARAGQYAEALAAAEKLGFEAECRRASGAELLTLADAARLSGSAARADQAYTAARSKLPGGGRASYGLGLVAFDQRGDFSAAARWFETYLRDQPGGSLRAEATGRLLEALQRSGQRDKARALAEQYLAHYPRGAQAALAQQLMR